MKICVTSTGPTVDAPVDPRFGRCQYFVIVDSETMEHVAMPNPSIGAPSGAGIQAAQSVANTGAQVVITGTVGPNATQTLGAAGIQMVTGASGTVSDAVEQYKSGRLQAAPAAPGAPAPGMPAPIMPGAGMGRGMGRGGGRGMGGGMGRGMGMGMGMGVPVTPAPAMPTMPPQTREQELQILESQMRTLEGQMEEIKKRLEELKK
ncbi:MAG: DUF5320 family protein [Methanosarcinales archaeon]|nr:DUF5320 family protein [Methanosarcinales archaeon]